KVAADGEPGRMSPTLEVAMRPPEVFVRELTPEEGQRLKSISRRAKYQAKRQRAMIVLASSTGMAAPQIAVPLRMIAIDVRDHPKALASHGLMVLVNPTVVEESGSEVGREGCLSLPEITANVVRAVRVRFCALWPDEQQIESMTWGFEARALLHEIDHLDGTLILDRVASAAEVFERRRK
ncbi:MAG: peptide deformylase, partial [Actinobacteria bacterium]|nr:peptide deformylase [Actinomycetota bacterium]